MSFSLKINRTITTGSVNYVDNKQKSPSPEAYYKSLNSISASYSNNTTTISNPQNLGNNVRIENSIQPNPFNYRTNLFTEIKGKLILSTNTELINVNQTLSNLSNDHLATETEDINMASLNVLAALGCSITTGNSGRNLLDERTNDAKIDNVNIRNRRPLPNRRKSTNKSFPDVDDPFYKDDSGKQVQKTKEIQKAANKRISLAKQSLPIASYLASSGLVPKYKTSAKNYRTSKKPPQTLTKGLK